VRTFAQFLAELRFRDLPGAPTGQWIPIPPNALTKARREPPPNLDTELFDLIQKSYGYAGGYPDFPDASDLPGNHSVWWAADFNLDGDPDVVLFGKRNAVGLKLTGMATDGSRRAKMELLTRLLSGLHNPGTYAEVSHGVLNALTRDRNLPVVTDPDVVQRVLGDKPITWIGADPEGRDIPPGFYQRNIAGRLVTKLMIGRPIA
jgi:hypothetical protein